MCAGLNSDYIEAMYESWQHDNSSVHVSWDAYFKTGGFARAGTEEKPPIIYHVGGDGSDSDCVRLLNLIRAYQVRKETILPFIGFHQTTSLKLILSEFRSSFGEQHTRRNQSATI